MSYRVQRFEPTPNPNAVKCVLDRPICQSPRSFRTPDAGQNDPVAQPLFSIPGVTLLLLGGDWITIGKSPDAQWSPIKKAVKLALKELAAQPDNQTQ